jgi:hypothetical protein
MLGGVGADGVGTVQLVTFPTPYTVGHHAASVTGDRFRNPVVYSPPRDEPGTPVAVIQIAAPQSAAGTRDGHQQLGYDRTMVDIDLYVPPEFLPHKGDLIDIPGMGQFEVVGYPEDHNHGFHQWQPGNVIPLRRVEG